ncbi:ABC transporter substrate-binding protein [Paenibacillus segetis]|uniref:ABC transporter substrate-binding protein n=1 Tax=Paenibacillus segetis TaxID=1325360 RepID=A0ABQ1YSV2_9BACL|nr:ABC transporter substrate-binding protein [Paenibacillus segetis]GGH36622.1 ABC transporter substrate-binding protein [Paenibacillus segetis]
MKKSFKLGTLCILMSVLLAACGGGGNTADSGTEGSNANANGASNEKVSFEFWYGLPSVFATSFEQLVQDFNASHPNIEVVPVNNGDVATNALKLQAALIAGNQPAVSLMDMSQMGQFAGSLQDLNAYYPQESIAKFNDNLLKNSYVEDKFIAVPFNRSVSLLFYNKGMFEKAGISEAPKTWDELHATAKKLSDKANNVYGFATAADMIFLENAIYSEGGTIISPDNKTMEINSPAGQKVIQMLQDMVKDGSANIPTGDKMNAMTQLSTDFASGKLAMIPMSSAAMTSILKSVEGRMDVGVTFLPAGTQNAVAATGSNLVMFSKSSEEQKTAAGQFLQWMTEKDNIAFLSKSTGYVPVTQEAVDTETIQQLWKETPVFRVPYDELQYAHPRPIVKNYAEMNAKIEDEVTKALLDLSITPAEALQAASDQAQSVLDASNK